MNLLEANATVLGLPISGAQRPGVLGYLALAESMYQGLLDVPLEPGDESAVVFVPRPPEAPHG
jgi:hypothetical protein